MCRTLLTARWEGAGGVVAGGVGGGEGLLQLTLLFSMPTARRQSVSVHCSGIIKITAVYDYYDAPMRDNNSTAFCVSHLSTMFTGAHPLTGSVVVISISLFRVKNLRGNLQGGDSVARC